MSLNKRKLTESVQDPKGITVFDGVKDAPQFQLGKSRKKQNTNIKRDEINIMNIINDNILNLHHSLFKKWQ